MGIREILSPALLCTLHIHTLYSQCRTGIGYNSHHCRYCPHHPRAPTLCPDSDQAKICTQSPGDALSHHWLSTQTLDSQPGVSGVVCQWEEY